MKVSLVVTEIPHLGWNFYITLSSIALEPSSITSFPCAEPVFFHLTATVGEP